MPTFDYIIRAELVAELPLSLAKQEQAPEHVSSVQEEQQEQDAKVRVCSHLPEVTGVRADNVFGAPCFAVKSNYLLKERGACHQHKIEKDYRAASL